MNLKTIFTFFTLAALAAAPMLAQLFPANAEGVTMGHMHIATRNIDAQKAFFVDALGGKIVKNGTMEMVSFPGVLVMFTKSENPPTSRGSIVDHFGFTVKDMPGAIAKWKAMNLTIEPTPNPNEVYVLGPEEMRIEVYGVPEQPNAIQMNHIHWNIADIPGMQAWYDKMFDAKTGQRDCVACLPRKVPLEEGRLAGTSLSYSKGAATLVGSKGRALDHIGFEVKDLDGFVKKLEAKGIKMDSPVRQLPNSPVKIAFLTDPYGTYIELTENLAPKN